MRSLLLHDPLSSWKTHPLEGAASRLSKFIHIFESGWFPVNNFSSFFRVCMVLACVRACLLAQRTRFPTMVTKKNLLVLLDASKRWGRETDWKIYYFCLAPPKRWIKRLTEERALCCFGSGVREVDGVCLSAWGGGKRDIPNCDDLNIWL